MKIKLMIGLTAILAVVSTAVLGHVKSHNTFDGRVIQNADGTYTAEYYWSQPGFRPDPNAFHVSLEQAKAAAKTWDDIATGACLNPKVIQ